MRSDPRSWASMFSRNVTRRVDKFRASFVLRVCAVAPSFTLARARTTHPVMVRADLTKKGKT